MQLDEEQQLLLDTDNENPDVEEYVSLCDF